MNILAVIPARGGSKRIPGKNVRLMCGRPLISYSIMTALDSAYRLDVVVSTDDDEVARISQSLGTKVIKRPPELAADHVTLDPVIYHAVCEMERLENKTYDIVITMQPTSPLLKTITLDNAIDYFLQEGVDTLISGNNRPHLAWTELDGKIMPLYEKRVNRQYLPRHLQETGAFIISKRNFSRENGRFGPNVSVYEMPENESVDIDTPEDWWIAEKHLSMKSILLRTDGYTQIGLGHIYRCLLLAYNLIDHEIMFVLSQKSDLGLRKIQESNFPYVVINDDYEIGELISKYDCDILLNDILDTNETYMQFCKGLGVRVVNFEDLGPGAALADAVINDLYERSNNLANHYWGSDYYCIRDEFLLAEPTHFKKTVGEVLIVFGGTDPNDLTYRLFNIVKSLPFSGIHYTFILGMGYKNADKLIAESSRSGLNIEVVQNVKHMSLYMGRTDIAVSSQGRTMLELASMGVPTILLAQNERELHHEFGYLENGFINLGLASIVEDQTIYETLLWLINTPQLRQQVAGQMSKKDLKKGIQRVLSIILNQTL